MIMMKKILLLLTVLALPIYSEIQSDITFTTEGYYQTDQDNDNWSYDYFDRKPFIDFEIYGHLNDIFYFYVQLPLEKDRLIAENPNDLDKNYTNVIYSAGDIDFHIPKVSFITLGNDKVNLNVGRNKLKIGEGLILNDKVFYYDFIKLNSNVKNLTYDFHFLSLDEFDNEKYYILHGLGYNFKDLVSLSITEGILLEGLGFDLSYLNPFSILHNEFLAYEEYANAIMAFNLTLTPMDKLEIAGELAVDQLVTPYEASRWEQEEANAVAWTVRGSYSIPVGLFSILMETSFTHSEPYYGIDSTGPAFNTTKKYVTRSQGDYDNAEGIPVTDPVIFAPDTQLFEFNTTLTGIDKLIVDLEYSLKRSGAVNMNQFTGENKNYEPYDEDVIKAQTPSGKSSSIHTITARGTYSIMEDLSVMLEVSQLLLNSEADTQFVLSVEYRL